MLFPGKKQRQQIPIGEFRNYIRRSFGLQTGNFLDDNQELTHTHFLKKEDNARANRIVTFWLLSVCCILPIVDYRGKAHQSLLKDIEQGGEVASTAVFTKVFFLPPAILDLMGEIKDGTVSGFLPSTEAFIVHYPGYPSCTSRAVETLGGYEGILKARCSDSNKLELRFRPEDPFCHPASGELRHCNNFLLKISRRSKSFTNVLASHSHNVVSNFQIEQPGEQPPDSVASVTEDQTRICANITTHVSEAYHFTGMADYQHVVAVHADMASKKKRKGKEPGQHSFEKEGPSSFDGEDVMMLVPPLFSPKDAPTTVVLSYRPNISSSRRKLDVDGKLNEALMERSLALDFKIKEIPSKVAWEEHMPQGSEDWEKQMALAKLFDEQPIWPKRSLNEKLLAMGFNLGSLMPKRLLINVAYYFNNGPFLKFWIRKGYDPRKDPESRIYQGIDFRVPQQLQSYCEPAETTKSDCRWEDICTFRIFPRKCHLSLQLFELSDDYIQQEIRNSPLQQSCTFKNGWFVNHVLDTIRQRAMMRFLSVYPQPGAEGFLKQASERFEKLKRIRLRDTSLKEQKIQQDIEDSREEEEHEDIESDNDFEGGEIAENGEEEMDAYDVLDQEAETVDTLQLNSYTEVDNISRTYLQELFGSFPAPEGDGPGHDMQNLDEDDGEYEIYEQDSDDGYSDEY